MTCTWPQSQAPFWSCALGSCCHGGSPSHTRPPPNPTEAPSPCTSAHTVHYFLQTSPTTQLLASVFLCYPQLSEEPKFHHPALPTCLKEPPPEKNTKQTHTRGTSKIHNFHFGAVWFCRFKPLMLKGWRTLLFGKPRLRAPHIAQLKFRSNRRGLSSFPPSPPTQGSAQGCLGRAGPLSSPLCHPWNIAPSAFQPARCEALVILLSRNIRHRQQK